MTIIFVPYAEAYLISIKSTLLSGVKNGSFAFRLGLAKSIYYVLIDSVGRPDGRIFGHRIMVKTEDQIFSRPARPTLSQ